MEDKRGRPKGMPKKAIQMYIPIEVYEYLAEKTAGITSVPAYIFQRSGVMQEYRQHLEHAQTQPDLPAVLEMKDCTTCFKPDCDPACPLYNHRY